MDQLLDADPSLTINTELLADLFEQAPGFMAVLRGPDHIFELANPAYRELIGDRDIIGKPVAAVTPEAAEQGYLDILTEVFRTGEAYTGSAMEVRLQNRDEAVFVDFVMQPIRDKEGDVTGIFIQGTDVTIGLFGPVEKDAAEYRKTPRVFQPPILACASRHWCRRIGYEGSR